ncbi:MAG TPA: S-layer homology domain-containing protein [Symbiobacteriaceae bacterium]|nr:S-layer homology domain-containing protein [Symbiobacteriaceae bacterium]
MRRRALAGFLTLLLVVSTMLSANVRTAAAAVTEADYQSAARQLNKYGLVQGDDRGYRFYDQITRAELAKLLVYSLGMESEANRYAGRGNFPDTQGHWADGVVGVAKSMGLMRGYPEGDFRPQSPLTNAEVITALARLAGLEGSSEPWPRTYWNPALDAGIIPGSMEAPLRARLSDTAGRGDVFVLLWRTLTEVKNYEGQNLLRRYLDRTPPAVTLDPLPDTTPDMLLDVTGTVTDAVKVLVNGQPANISEYGYFKGTVALRKGPNTIRVQAIDDAGNVKEVTAQVARSDSPAGAIALSGPATVPAGGTAAFTMVIKDQNGETIPDRSQVKARVEPEDLGRFDPATATFTAGTRQASGQITVTAGGAMGIALVTVTAGAPDRLVISPAEVAVDALDSVQFTVQSYDKGGNEVPVPNVRWSATGGTITATGRFTAPNTPGKFTITATADGRTATAVVLPPNHRVASVKLVAPTTKLKANGVSETTMTATLYDDKNAVVTDYQGTLAVTSSNEQVAAPVDEQVAVVGGVATINVRAGSKPGAAVISVKTNLGKVATATVNTEAQKLQAIRLSGTPVPSSDTKPTAFVEAVAVDTEGNPMRTPLPEVVAVHLTLPGGTAIFVQNGKSEADIALGAVDPETGEVRTRTVVQYELGSGTQVITGKIVAEDTQDWIKIYPGAFTADQVGIPAKVRIEPLVDGAAGEPQTVYVNILDADGYRVTTPLLLAGSAVTLRDQNGVVWPVDPAAPGAGPGRVGFTVVQTKAGAYTYTATLQPAYATATAQGSVLPGEATQVQLSAKPADLVADSKSKTTLRAEVRDAYGNLVKGAYQVTFRQVTSTGALQSFPEQTLYTRDGVAELSITVGSVVAHDDVEAVVLHPGVPNGRVSDTVRIVTQGAPERLAISYGDNDGDGTENGPEDYAGRIGRPLTVYVNVVDRFGNTVVTDNNRRISLTLRNQTTGKELPAMTASTKDGRATFSITRNDAAAYAMRAESGDLMKAFTVGYGGAVADALIQPGGTLQIEAVADLTTLQAGGTSYAEIAVRLKDAQGNVTPNQTGRPIAVTVAFPNDTNRFNWGFFTVNDDPSGTRTWSRTVVINANESQSAPVRFFSGATGTSRTLTATTLDGATSAVTIKNTTLGSIAKAVIQPIQPVALQPWSDTGDATDGQLVVVDVQDAKGNRLTSYNGAVTLTAHNDDVRIVAVYQGGEPVSVGAVPEYTATADRGRAAFVVRANLPGVKLYEVTAVDGLLLTPGQVTATGRFDGEAPAGVKFDTDTYQVRQDASITFKVRFQDRFGANLQAAGGTVTFTSDDGQFSQTVPVVSGVATVTYRAPAVDGTVIITATSSLLDAGGAPITNTATVIVDATGPVLDQVTFTAGRVDPDRLTATEGDTITLTFNEAIDGASILAALRPGTTLTSGLGTIQFEAATARMVFAGLPNLGALDLTGVMMAGAAADATYQIASLSLDTTGKVLTIKLGKLLSGTAPTVDASGSGMTVNWEPVTVRDKAGNLAPTEFGVPVSGHF